MDVSTCQMYVSIEEVQKWHMAGSHLLKRVIAYDQRVDINGKWLAYDQGLGIGLEEAHHTDCQGGIREPLSSRIFYSLL